MINPDPLLVAYVDGELDPDEAPKVEALLATDPRASQRVEMFRETAALLRDACGDRFFAGESPVPGPRRRRGLHQRRHGWAIATSLAAAILGFGGGVTCAVVLAFGGGFAARGTQQPNPLDFSERLIDEVADYHVVYAREDEHLVEVSADRRRHIEDWLGDRLDRELHVPDLSSHGLTFRGARLLVVDGRPVGQLVYSRPDRPHRPLALCISFGSPGEEALRMEAREGVTLALWRRQGYYYVLAGWIDKTELGTLAAEVAPELDRRRALEGVTPRAAVNSSIRSEAPGESQGWPALPLAESHTGKI